MELLLGCGHSREKKMYIENKGEWNDLVTVDSNCNCSPDIIYDLEALPLPFLNETVDEIHLYHVLEHLGKQGDYLFFFDQFADFHRILKHGGLIFAQCPSYKSLWAFGDPSHCRVLNSGMLVYLSQDEYINQLAQKRPMTDFRDYYKCDFKIAAVYEDDEVFNFILEANKKYGK